MYMHLYSFCIDCLSIYPKLLKNLSYIDVVHVIIADQ